MTNLQPLRIFLTERLMLAAQEIFKAVEVTITEYHDEISRSRQENELLKSRLLEAGIQVYPELQPGLSVFHREPCPGSERRDPGEKIQVKQEPSASREEPQVPPPQTSVPEEPVSPAACLEDEQKIEEMLHPQMTDISASPLLEPHQCMQIKEETDESKSGLGTEIFCMTQSSTSDDLSSAVASNHAIVLETQLDDLSSMQNASELPLTSRMNAGHAKMCTNYEQDKEHQRRERYSMIRARGIGKLPKVGRERKMEPRIENQRTCKKKEKVPEVLMLEEEQCMQRQLRVSTGSMNERNVHPVHKSSAVYQSEPEAYLCVVCGRSFSSRGLLKVHLRVHSGERPYHCPYCDKNFRQSSHLSVHIRIHTGEKPYSCLSCGKRFSDRSACNRHVRAHLENAELSHPT